MESMWYLFLNAAVLVRPVQIIIVSLSVLSYAQ